MASGSNKANNNNNVYQTKEKKNFGNKNTSWALSCENMEPGGLNATN